ncbi:MAG: heparinase II/III family protein [Chromatiaceae bacterium]
MAARRPAGARSLAVSGIGLLRRPLRVARRARPLHSEVRETADGVRFDGAIRGFPALGGGIVHRRVIEYAWDGVWRVMDTVGGRGRHLVESRLH